MTQQERSAVFAIARRRADGRRLLEVFDDSLRADFLRARVLKDVVAQLGVPVVKAEAMVEELLEP